MLKIIILSETNLIDAYTQKVLQPVREDPRFKIAGLVIHPRPQKPIRQKLKAFRRRLKGGAFLVMIIEKLIRKFSMRPGNTNSGRKPFTSFFHEQQFPELRFNRLDKSAYSQIKKLNADQMILAGYFQIVRNEIIDLMPRGVLSFHYGDMRKYRGQPPIFWELLQGESSIGVTIQQISAGIDQGAPVEEMNLTITNGDTIYSLEERILVASEGMMYKALCRYLDPVYSPEALPSYGPLYTFPGLFTWVMFQLKFNLFK